MTRKRVLFDAAAHEKILHGATALADAVLVTFGLKSKRVLIGRKWGPPLVCDDGVTVAKEFDAAKAGIVDSTKVVRTALQNAVSVAGILLLTEATMTEVPDEPKGPHVRDDGAAAEV